MRALVVGKIGPRTRLAAVLGAPVAHSHSPVMHNAAFVAAHIDAVFLALHVEPADLRAVIAGLRAVRPLGLSITVPHKEAMVRLVDRLAPPADEIGAVNCVALAADGAWVGHNTDAPGFIDGLREGLGLDPAGARAVVLGGGGAARAVASGLLGAGASVDIVARAPSRVTWAQVPARPWNATQLADALPRCDLLVDATSMALDGTPPPVPVPLDRLPAGAAVVSLIYHRDTALLTAARARGLRTLDGSLMLLHQGTRAFSLWTGRKAPLEVMRTALAAAG